MRGWLSRLALTGMAALFLQQASACGYHASVNNPFTLTYPGSISLAVATREALDDNIVRSLLPVQGVFGFKRSVGWLNRLVEELGRQSGDLEYQILVVNSGLWSSVRPGDQGPLLETHIEPSSSEPVLLISEELLSALLLRQVDSSNASDRSLFDVKNDPGDRLRQSLLRAFPSQSSG